MTMITNMAQWESGWAHILLKILAAHMFSNVKLNFTESYSHRVLLMTNRQLHNLLAGGARIWESSDLQTRPTPAWRRKGPRYLPPHLDIWLVYHHCFGIQEEWEKPIAGIFFVLPCIEAYQKVDLRTITLGVPPQEVRAHNHNHNHNHTITQSHNHTITQSHNHNHARSSPSGGVRSTNWISFQSSLNKNPKQEKIQKTK